MEEMVVEVRKWMQVSHLFWWLWGMIQIKISNIEGFDAKNYCHVRWNEYMKHKEETLQLPHPPRLLASSPPFQLIFPSASPNSPLSPTDTSAEGWVTAATTSTSDHPKRASQRRRRSSKLQDK